MTQKRHILLCERLPQIEPFDSLDLARDRLAQGRIFSFVWHFYKIFVDFGGFYATMILSKIRKSGVFGIRCVAQYAYTLCEHLQTFLEEVGG